VKAMSFASMEYNNKKLEQLFKEKYGDEALELAIELGFDKEELLNNI
jgi:hypothetical protein